MGLGEREDLHSCLVMSSIIAAAGVVEEEAVIWWIDDLLPVMPLQGLGSSSSVYLSLPNQYLPTSIRLQRTFHHFSNDSLMSLIARRHDHERIVRPMAQTFQKRAQRVHATCRKLGAELPQNVRRSVCTTRQKLTTAWYALCRYLTCGRTNGTAPTTPCLHCTRQCTQETLVIKQLR